MPAVHAFTGRSETFPIVLQLLMDHPDGLTVTEMANFARDHGLVEETEVAGVGTQTRVRRAINSAIELGYAVEAGKAAGKGGAMRYKFNPEGVQQNLDDGLMEFLMLFAKKYAHRIPDLTGEKMVTGLRDVLAKHELLGMKLREIPDSES